MYRLTALAAFIVAGLVSASFLSAKDKSGFDGKWQLDKKADITASDYPRELRQNIKQKGDELTIESTFAEPASGIAPLLYLGIMTSRMEIKADGTEQEARVGPYTMKLKTVMDGNTMTTDWTTNYKGDPVEGKWVRTIADDQKHMTLKITESSTQGQHGDATLPFVRK